MFFCRQCAAAEYGGRWHRLWRWGWPSGGSWIIPTSLRPRLQIVSSNIIHPLQLTILKMSRPRPDMLGCLVICEYAIAYFAKIHISHIFLHIMAFAKLHMRKLCRISKTSHIFAHMRSHFSAFFLSNVVLRPLNIFGSIDYWLPIIIYN